MVTLTSQILRAAEFDDNSSRRVMPRLYEHIDRPNLWSQAQEKENARLLPLIKLLAERLEASQEALNRSLPAGTWFHLGPYGATPEKDDYDFACKVFQENAAAIAGIIGEGV